MLNVNNARLLTYEYAVRRVGYTVDASPQHTAFPNWIAGERIGLCLVSGDLFTTKARDLIQ